MTAIDLMKQREYRAKYYSKSDGLDVNSRALWTTDEDEAILEWDGPDLELSELLGRSLRAIHNRRARLSKRQAGRL